MKEAIKSELSEALNSREAIISELVRKGLAQRKSYGVDMRDTRHPLYPRYKAADSRYWNALHAASEAGVVTVHTNSFSWN